MEMNHNQHYQASHKRDHENFKELETVVKHPLGSLKCLQLLYTRSRFHKVSVKQFHAGLVEEGFVMSPDLLKLASWRARLMGQSVPVEEMIGHVKNSKIANGTTKFRRPDLMMYRAIVGNSFADSRLRYSMPSMEAPVLTKKTRLPSESYRSCKKTASVDVSDVVSTRPPPLIGTRRVLPTRTTQMRTRSSSKSCATSGPGTTRKRPGWVRSSSARTW